MEFKDIINWSDCVIEYDEQQVPEDVKLTHKRQPLAPRLPWRLSPLPINVSIIVTGVIQSCNLRPVGDWNGYVSAYIPEGAHFPSHSYNSGYKDEKPSDSR